MPKKIITTLITFFIALCILCESYAAVPQNRSFKSKFDKSQTSTQQSIGLIIKDWAIAIDAIYNPNISKIIPGYHIVNIVLTNQRPNPIQLYSDKDKWIIVDNLGKKHTAYNHVTQFNKELWAKLPKKLQELINYPQVVNPGRSTTIDVFIPDSVDLFNFREVIWKSAHFKKEFNLFTDYESNLSIEQNPNEFKTPRSSSDIEKVLQTTEKINEDQIKYIKSKLGEKSDIENINEDDKANNQPPFDPSLDDILVN